MSEHPLQDVPWHPGIPEETRNWWESFGFSYLGVRSRLNPCFILEFHVESSQNIPGGRKGSKWIIAFLEGGGDRGLPQLHIPQVVFECGSPVGVPVEEWMDATIHNFPGVDPLYVRNCLLSAWNDTPKEVTAGVKLVETVSRKSQVLNE